MKRMEELLSKIYDRYKNRKTVELLIIKKPRGFKYAGEFVGERSIIFINENETKLAGTCREVAILCHELGHWRRYSEGREYQKIINRYTDYVKEAKGIREKLIVIWEEFVVGICGAFWVWKNFGCPGICPFLYSIFELLRITRKAFLKKSTNIQA